MTTEAFFTIELDSTFPYKKVLSFERYCETVLKEMYLSKYFRDGSYFFEFKVDKYKVFEPYRENGKIVHYDALQCAKKNDEIKSLILMNIKKGLLNLKK